MGGTLADVLGAVFPQRRVSTIEERSSRPGNVTALVTFADGERLFLKTATDGGDRLVRETAATRFAGERCPVGVPAVAAADPRGDPPFLATRPLRGVALADRWETGDGTRERLLRRAGRLIAGVHEVRFDRPGRILGGDGTGLDVEEVSWSEVLAATVEERAADLYAARFGDVPDRLATVVRDAGSLLDEAPTTLLHGGPTRTNCRIDPPGLLDWERALVGDPGLDIADAIDRLVDRPDVGDGDRERLKRALLTGYRGRAESLPEGFDRRRPLYRAVAFNIVPKTFELWAPAAEDPTDDLEAWVREEFDARLARAREAIERREDR